MLSINVIFIHECNTQKKLATNVPAKAVKSRKPFKFDVECTLRNRMASQLMTTTEDVKKKDKLIADRKDTVKNTTKGFHGTLHIKTSDDISCCQSADKGKKVGNVYKNVKHTKKITNNARKHSADLDDAEFFEFVRKGDYRLRLPVEVVKRAGLSVNLYSLSVQNITGVMEVYDVKTKLNGGKPRYALDGRRKFMSDNNLKFGDTLYFTYMASQQKIVLNDVMPV
ncbi:putative transcription factor B3-Domain family [Helianthus anomalus]